MHYLLIASFMWGSSFIATKLAYAMIDPVLVVLFRLLLATLVTLPISYHYVKDGNSLSRQKLMQIIVLGSLTYPVTYLLQISGLKLIPAVSAVTIIGMEPIIIVLVGLLFFREKTPVVVFILGIVAFIGVLLVVGKPQQSHDGISLLGCSLVFSSTIVMAFWIRLSQKFMRSMNVKIYTALTLQTGTLFGLPLMLPLVEQWQMQFSGQGVGAIIYLGIGCSLMAAWCWNKGLETVSASISGIFLALEPVFGVVLAVVLLKESVTMQSLLGMIMVMGAATACIFIPKKVEQ